MAKNTKPLRRQLQGVRAAESGDTMMPPENVNIPQVPGSFPLGAGNLRGVKPRKEEVNAMIEAVEELRRFHDYAAVFGGTAPPYADLMRQFERAAAWSGMRVKLASWDGYCRVQEEGAWRDARKSMAALKTAMALIAKVKRAPLMHLVQTQRLVTAMSRISRKGAASRKANAEAEAEGKPPVRGRRAQRAARAKA